MTDAMSAGRLAENSLIALLLNKNPGEACDDLRTRYAREKQRLRIDLEVASGAKVRDSDLFRVLMWGSSPREVYVAFATYLWELDLDETALSLLRVAASIGDDWDRLRLAEALAWSGRSTEAEALFREISTNDSPLGDWACGDLAALLLKSGRTDDAEIEPLARRAAPVSGDFAVQYAELLVLRGHISDAVALLRRESDEGNDAAPLVLGNILDERLSDVAGAQEAYRRGIALGDAHSAYNSALISRRDGDEAEAMRMFLRAAEMGDEQGESAVRDSVGTDDGA